MSLLFQLLFILTVLCVIFLSVNSQISEREQERRKAQQYYLNKKRAPYDIWDEFKTSPLKELYYTLKLKGAHMDLISAMAPDRDITDTFLEHIEYIVTHKKNLIFFIVDETGEGKSVVGIAIMLVLVRAFKKFKQVDSNLTYTFDIDQTLKKLTKMKDCDVNWQDEDSDLSGKDSRTVVHSITNLFETMRSTQKCVGIASPSFRYVSGVTVVFHLMGKFEKYFETQKDEDMKTRLVVRYMPPDGEGKLEETFLGWCTVPLAEANQRYNGEYLRLKKENYERLESAAGQRSPGGHSEYLESLVPKLTEICLSKGWDGAKSDVEAYIDFLRDENGRPYSFSSGDRTALCVYTANTFKMGKKIKPIKSTTQENKPTSDVSGEYKFDLNQALDDLSKKEITNWEDKERDLEIFKRITIKFEKPEDIAKEMKCSPSNISKIRGKITGMITEIEGHKFEHFYGAKLQSAGKYVEVTVMGGSGDPDIVCKGENLLHVYSSKTTLTGRKALNLSKDEFNPEIRLCLESLGKFAEIKCFVVFHHLLNGNDVFFELNYQNPQKRYNIEFT